MTTARNSRFLTLFGNGLEAASLKSTKSLKNTKLIFQDVGGNGDCGYRAIAAAIIDNAINQPSEKNEELINKLFEFLEPLQKNEPPSTPIEHLKKVIKTPFEIAKLVKRLALVLRQIAYKEVEKNPTRYVGPFTEQHENTSLEEMRKPNNWIDETAIAAISTALELPIEVRLVGPRHEIPKIFHYNDHLKTTASPVAIQLQNSHYMPAISRPDLFRLVNTPYSDPNFQENELQNDADSLSPELIEQIEKENKEILKEYLDTSRRLAIMVQNKEISMEELLAIYVGGIGKSDYLAGRVKYIGMEHGNEHFFDTLEEVLHKKAQNKPVTSTPIEFTQKRYKEEITLELIHALARAVSIGQLEEAKVFQSTEETKGQEALKIKQAINEPEATEELATQSPRPLR